MIEQLRTVLKAAFGIDAREIEKVRGGWSADAYKVHTAGEAFFLKVYDRSLPTVQPWAARIDGYIPALQWLGGQAPLRGRVAQPVPTADGGYKWADERYTCLVFAYIDGETVGSAPLAPAEAQGLAQTVAALHSLGTPDAVPGALLAEDISVPFCGKLCAYLDSGMGENAALWALFAPYREMLRAAALETLRLRDQVREGYGSLVLCHTDLHGWNLMRAADGRLILIDWEGLQLAPAEADLFMFAENSGWDAFLREYSAARPGYRLNEPMLRYYLLRRKVEDVWEFTARILYEAPEKDITALGHGNIARLLEEIRVLTGR